MIRQEAIKVRIVLIECPKIEPLTLTILNVPSETSFFFQQQQQQQWALSTDLNDDLDLTFIARFQRGERGRLNLEKRKHFSCVWKANFGTTQNLETVKQKARTSG